MVTHRRFSFLVLIQLWSPAKSIPYNSATLRAAGAARGLLIGAATNAGYLANSSEPQYKATEQAEFSITTAENSCKVGPTHPYPQQYDFKGCDAVFAAAEDAGQKVRGHNLCWHQQNPDWLNSSLSHDQLVDALVGHISTVVTHYGTKAYAWDVVNEAVSDGGSGLPTIKKNYPPWMPTVPDFIDRAFTAARKAGGPSVKLFYNDYGAETMNAKSDRMYDLVTGMKSRGVPIDGVAFQTHISSASGNLVSNSKSGNLNDTRQFDILSMEKNLQRFAALGLEIHISELDVRACDAHSQCDEAALQRQAETYAGLMQMCLNITQCKVFEMWGFTDRHTWISDFQNPTHKDEMPLPFDADYKKKPAYTSMLAVLQGAPSPPFPPAPPPNHHKYQTQTTTCKNAVAVSGDSKVDSVAACEALCDADTRCVAVDTNGKDCYLKSQCDGTTGHCAGWCSYKKI